MNLLAKYSRINLSATIVIFLVASAAYYVLLSFILTEQIDEDLKIEEAEINTYIDRYGRLPVSISVNDQLISYTAVKAPFNKRRFITTSLQGNNKKNKEAFRQLVFGVTASGMYYRVTVSKSLEDTDSLIHSILLITFLTITCMLAAAFIINRFVLKRLWKPFYITLDKVRIFKLGKDPQFSLPSEQVDEFDFMNKTVQRLIRQAQTDYHSLKTFSENASHEIQTPLAIIRSKLDILIQDDSLTDHQSRLLQSVYGAVEKLAKLNQSLLLLTKIENNQFEEKLRVDVKMRLESKLAEFQELWQSQDIRVTTSLNTASVSANTDLFEILLNNLFSNATRHNYTGGKIDVLLTHEELKISNTSLQPRLEAATTSQRFYKGAANTNDSVGLGLSIIRQICQSSGFMLDYFFTPGEHTFIIRWR